MATHASRDTTTGLLFEKRTSGKASGIPLHKTELGKYVTKKTKKYYSLSLIHPGKNNGVPKDKNERAEKFKGQYILTKALEPDEAYLDIENSTLTIFEKKFQTVNGSADEKFQTCAFKIHQYRKVAAELGIEHVYYIYILSDYFKSAYYADALEYIKSVPGCDYFFAEEK